MVGARSARLAIRIAWSVSGAPGASPRHPTAAAGLTGHPDPRSATSWSGAQSKQPRPRRQTSSARRSRHLLHPFPVCGGTPAEHRCTQFVRGRPRIGASFPQSSARDRADFDAEPVGLNASKPLWTKENGGEDGIRTHETLLRSAPLAGARSLCQFLLLVLAITQLSDFRLYRRCTSGLFSGPERFANDGLRIVRMRVGSEHHAGV